MLREFVNTTGDLYLSLVRSLPFEMRHHHLPSRPDRRIRAGTQPISFDHDHAGLGLSGPIREQRHEQGMGQRLLLFIDVEEPGVRDLRRGLLTVLLGRPVEPVLRGERAAIGPHQLRPFRREGPRDRQADAVIRTRFPDCMVPSSGMRHDGLPKSAFHRNAARPVNLAGRFPGALPPHGRSTVHSPQYRTG